MEKEVYQTGKEELLAGVNREKGLESHQAVEILQREGENVLQESKKKSVLAVFASQFADLLVIGRHHHSAAAAHASRSARASGAAESLHGFLLFGVNIPLFGG